MTQERKVSEEEEKLVPKGIADKLAKYQESHWREKYIDLVFDTRTANRHR